MRYFEASSIIAAGSEAVWAVLSDGTYELAPAAPGGTAFRVREEYTGPLLGLIWRSMPDLGPSFERFASRLRLRVGSGG
jgi:hypothetical protein